VISALSRPRAWLIWPLLVLALIFSIGGTIPPRRAEALGGTFATGVVYYDLNGNGHFDPGEPRAPDAVISWATSIPGAKGQPSVADSNGSFSIDLSGVASNPSGKYVIAAQGTNTVGSVLGITYVLAEGTVTPTISSGQSVSIDIGLDFVGRTNIPTHFAIEGTFQNYFDRRGGVETFGYPVSRLFLFQGFPTQVFQRSVLQRWPDGSVHLLNLLDPGLIQATTINGAVLPGFDSSLVAQAPSVGSPAYIQQALSLVTGNVPNVVDGQAVNFLTTFQHTVSLTAAFPPVPPVSQCQEMGIPIVNCTPGPGYRDATLLPGFDLEIWGLPTSRPTLDPRNSQFIYQRFQRGIMHFQANLGVTEGLLLGQYFKTVLTGQDLPADLAQQMSSSPHLRQYCPGNARWICRPNQLDPTGADLTGAFEPLGQIGS
jgi:hypothetical protein